MKIFISKTSRNSFLITKETTKQSILSDLFTILVIVISIGLDIVFSIFVTHSFVIDIFAVGMILLWLIAKGRDATKEAKTKEEVVEILNAEL